MTDDPTEFIYRYATYRDKEKLRARVEAHIKYKTCKILFDKTGMVCAVCLWNISPDGEVAEVTDMVIREDYRKMDLMRWILTEGRKIWPVKYLKFNRDYTEDGHDRWPEPKLFSVKRFLRRKG